MDKGRSQLQMMLLQQAGPGALPLSNLSLPACLEYVRKVEQIILDEKLSPLMVYWSSHDAQRFLPTGQRLRELKRDAFCFCEFSEKKSNSSDEWCLLVESNGLSMVVYGQQTADVSAGSAFQCAGSLDATIVRQAFNKMFPLWQFINLPESNLLEDARNNLGQAVTLPQLAKLCRAAWPVVKVRTQEIQVLQAPLLAGLVTPDKSSVQSGGSAEVGFIQPAMLTSAPDKTVSEAPVVKSPEPAYTAPGGASHAQGASQLAAEAQREGLTRASARRTTLEQTPSVTVVPVIPHAAQEIITEIIGQLRHSKDLTAILQLAIARLTQVGAIDRGLIWQVVGDQLAVTNEYSRTGHTCFVGNQLGSQESTAIVLQFLSLFPDESGAGVIGIPDTFHDTNLHKISPTMASLIELGDVRARLVAQLRCRGVFSGFLELQQCGKPRNWSEEDGAVLQHVSNMLSVVVQQTFDQSKILTDAEEMKLINEIANLFRESKGEKSRDMLVRSVELVSSHLGFVHSQIYLYNNDNGLLVPQMADGHHVPHHLSEKENPFVAVYESGRAKVINVEYTRKGDAFFGHDTALVVPLMSESERLGVVGLWERPVSCAQLGPHDRDLALTIAGQLANIVRADQAIAQVRADNAREALINRVTSAIREALKEVDQIMETPAVTMVESLQEHLGLTVCALALYDNQVGDFIKLRTAAGKSANVDASTEQSFAHKLFLSILEQLKWGQPIFLAANEIVEKLRQESQLVPQGIRSATLVPLVHAQEFRGALALVSSDKYLPLSEKDLKMVVELADRVAGAISHAELFAQVQRQAVTDPMTGLFNRRFFAEQLSKEIDRFQRFGHPFSYIIVDLDFLKKINDSLGHQFGDVAIKHIAQVLKRTTRDVDTAARYGGEEFVILLPVTDVKEARIAAERICVEIRAQTVEGVGTVTASVGVATFPLDADDRDKLTELADQALYLAKHRGRNRVCSVSEDLMPSLNQRGEEALEVQKHTIAKRAEEMPIDPKIIAEHGILGIMGTIVKFIEARDAYNKDRSPKAADYASKLAQALHLSKEHVAIISLAAVLNNLGKIALPEEILQKKGPLTDEERKVIEQSPVIGAKILEPAKQLHRVATVVESYHEHWDGSGYPKGIKGEEIPLESRIIALVDAYIAMTSDRPYREALSHQEAVRLLQEGSSKEWDPRLVKLFLAILQKDMVGARPVVS
ncbi:MAG: diguanylate cyclase [Candidatus Melainabacteria bacterium]|nr:diguanylate cyclase [Candidatus Melainabacteria bacterium]